MSDEYGYLSANRPKEKETTGTQSQSPYGPYVTPQSVLGDPVTAYMELLQQGLLPENLTGLNDPRLNLPAGTFFTDDEGRTMYNMPTQGRPISQEYNQDEVGAYIEALLAGEAKEDLPVAEDYGYLSAKRDKVQIKQAEDERYKLLRDQYIEDVEYTQEEIRKVQELGPENA